MTGVMLLSRRCVWPLVASMGLVGGTSLANTPQNISIGEVALLPEYCADVQSISVEGRPGAPTARQSKWLAVMGETFWAMHHYCWALLNLNRARNPGLTPQGRTHLREWAIKDIYYVIRLAPRDFPLLPEMYWKVGDIQVTLNLPVDAIQHFERSREVKPDYWPAYASLAELNVRLGRRQAALDVLKAGLEIMPDQPQLAALRGRISGAKKNTEITGSKAPSSASPETGARR